MLFINLLTVLATSQEERIARDKAISGDEKEKYLLRHEHERMVRSTVRRVLDSPSFNQDDIDDVVGETWLQVIKSFSSFEGKSKRSTWICQIAYWTALKFRDEYRKRHEQLPLTSTTQAVGDEERDLLEEHRGPDNTSETVFQILTKEKFVHAIEQLPERHRLCFTFHYLSGLTHNEIADALSIPIGTVKSNIHRAATRLRKILEKEEILPISETPNKENKTR